MKTKITPFDVDSNIVSEYYFTAKDGVLYAAEDTKDLPGAFSRLTFCLLVLQNGFTVTGESACADPVNFDPELGKQLARKNAYDKIWALMGYELRTNLTKAYDV